MNSQTYLLDSGVLIALVVREHEHHDVVTRWVAGAGRIALCPITEGALVRFLVRAGERPETATLILRHMHQSPVCEFWADTLSYGDAELTHIVGYRQVIDAYFGQSRKRPRIPGGDAGSRVRNSDAG